MTRVSEWLVELGAHTGSEQITLRYSSSGYTTKPGDTPANTEYDARINSIGAFTRHMFGDGLTMGPVSVELGDLVLTNADGSIDALKDYGFDGQPFVLKRLVSTSDPLSSAATVLTGTMEGIDSDTMTVRIRFYDRRRDVDVPLLTNAYGGTTTEGGATADGTPDMKGQLKPALFGTCFSVPAVIANPYDLILQFNDGPVLSIVLYDGGVPLTPGADYPDLATLQASTGNPGRYGTCLALGLAKPYGAFNGRPAYVWTADVVEGATATDRRAGAIAQRMLGKIGLSSAVDAASFSALAALATQDIGIYIDVDTSALTAIRKVLGSVGASMFPNAAGDFEVELFVGAGTPIEELVEPDIYVGSRDETLSLQLNNDTDGNIPAYRVDLKYTRYWHVHSESDLGTCVGIADPARATQLKLEWREEQAETPAVLTKHALSNSVQVETYLTQQADAAAEAIRRLALYDVTRSVVLVGVDALEADALTLNKTVTLTVDALGFGSGQQMVIIGRSDDYQKETTTLTLWG